MFYLIRENENGQYTTKAGVVVEVIEGQYIYQPGKEVNEGCKEYADLDACIAGEELTKIEDEETKETTPETTPEA